jgi:hypothetical protein
MTGGLTPAEGADRLARNHCRRRGPLIHGIGVHERRHHLLVGPMSGAMTSTRGPTNGINSCISA